MKKIITAFSVAIIGVLALAGCTAEPAVFDTLDDLAKKSYSAIELHVSVELDGETLAGSYRATATAEGYRIEYTYETRTTFSEENGDFVIPDDYKTVKEGSVSVKDGEVVSREGDEADLPVGCMTALSFSFAEANFSESKAEEGVFTAKVKNVGAFLGQTLSASDMAVELRYTETAFTSLTLSYRSGGGASVVYSYAFTI